MNLNSAVRFGLLTAGLLAVVVATMYSVGYVQGLFKAAAADDEYLPYRATPTSQEE